MPQTIKAVEAKGVFRPSLRQLVYFVFGFESLLLENFDAELAFCWVAVFLDIYKMG